MLQADKLELGLFGDSRPIGLGLSELRIHYGPGFRIYYGKSGANDYVLLLGGKKSTQSRDIKLAIKCWKNHERRKAHRS